MQEPALNKAQTKPAKTEAAENPAEQPKEGEGFVPRYVMQANRKDRTIYLPDVEVPPHEFVLIKSKRSFRKLTRGYAQKPFYQVIAMPEGWKPGK